MRIAVYSKATACIYKALTNIQQ